MAYSKILEEKVESIVGNWKGVEKKKMFGGICYILKSKTAFGIYKDYLIVRMKKHMAEQKLTEKNGKPFDITGKPINQPYQEGDIWIIRISIQHWS